ncbi:MAG: DUF2267 domain-containing protein [Elainellaceae cyanobacterium]
MANQAADQTADQQTFLEKVVEQSTLKSTNGARAATKVVFRILRDVMPTEEIEALEKDLQAGESKDSTTAADLWGDPNIMVAFFSRVSPLRQLNIGFETAMLRLEQEAALTKADKPEQVAMAIFSATKSELSDERIAEVARLLPSDGFRQMWEQA